eukprot:SAG22_NODE_2402_length_2615_cov_3.309618_3_plen_77_part_00
MGLRNVLCLAAGVGALLFLAGPAAGGFVSEDVDTMDPAGERRPRRVAPLVLPNQFGKILRARTRCSWLGRPSDLPP